MWQEADNQLDKRFEFKDFAEALDFVNKVGKLAEAANHHPDIEFGWGYANISLKTHSAGKVTNKDRQLAGQIDQIAS